MSDPLSYLLRQDIFPKPEASDPEAACATLDHQFIQRAQIVRTANVNDDDLEHSGLSKKTPIANSDNSKLFEIVKAVSGKTQHRQINCLWS